jgi:hypothetical protein
MTAPRDHFWRDTPMKRPRISELEMRDRCFLCPGEIPEGQFVSSSEKPTVRRYVGMKDFVCVQRLQNAGNLAPLTHDVL